MHNLHAAMRFAKIFERVCIRRYAILRNHSKCLCIMRRRSNIQLIAEIFFDKSRKRLSGQIDP